MNYFQQMLTKSLSVLKKFSILLLVVYAVALTAGSLMDNTGMPDLGSDFDDKVYHFIAYAIYTIFAYNVFSHKQKKYKIVYAIVFVLIYGIIIEILQHVLTDNRTLDINDVFANTLGVVLAATVLMIRRKLILKMNA